MLQPSHYSRHDPLRHPRHAYLGALAVLLTGSLVFAFLVLPPSRPENFALVPALVMAALVWCGELLPLQLPMAGRVLPFTLTFDVALLVLFGPYTVLVGYLLGTAGLFLLLRGDKSRVLVQLLENGFAVLVGGLTLWAFAPPALAARAQPRLLAGGLAAGVRIATDLALTLTRISLQRREGLRAAWQLVFGGYAYLPLLVLAPLGLLGAYLYAVQPWLLVLLLAPFLAQYLSVHRHESLYTEVQHLREEKRRLEEELELRTTELNAAISQLQRRLSQNFSLQAVGTAIVQELDLERVFPIIARQAARIAGGDGAFITLLSDDGTRQLIRAASGPYLTAYVGEEISLDDSLTGPVISSGQPVINNDTLEDPRFRSELVYQARISALLAAPLKTKDKVLGVLGVVAHNGKRFDAEDMHLLTVLANQAAIAIENARLHERQRELAVYEERSRLARELHDSVTQSLFSISLYLEASLQVLDSSPSQARTILTRCQEIAQEAQAEMRSLIFELRPAAIREKGLDFALENLISLVRRRHNLEITLTKSGDGELPGDVEFCLYRVVQEALNNVTKHAAATRVEVKLTLGPRWVTLTVQDNGRGFDVSRVEASGRFSFGLTSMRERVAALGGRFEIRSRPGAGTLVRVQLPLPG